MRQHRFEEGNLCKKSFPHQGWLQRTKTNSLNTGHTVQLCHQPGQGKRSTRIPPVCGGLNTGENDLVTPCLSQGGGFRENIPGLLGSNSAPRCGNNAVRTPILASVLDLYVGSAASRRQQNHIVIGGTADIVHAILDGLALRQPTDNSGKLPLVSVADHGGHTGDGGCGIGGNLGEASCNDQRFPRIGRGGAADMLTGFAVALCRYRAGIDDGNVRFLSERHNLKAVCLQAGGDGIRFILIHTAPQRTKGNAWCYARCMAHIGSPIVSDTSIVP